MRQWVLLVPHGLRYRMAYDADLLSRVMRIFSRVVFQSMRKRASECGIPRGHCDNSRVLTTVPLEPEISLRRMSAWPQFSGRMEVWDSLEKFIAAMRIESRGRFPFSRFITRDRCFHK